MALKLADARILVLTALAKETAAVTAVFPPMKRFTHEKSGHVYELAEITNIDGHTHVVALYQVPRDGNLPSLQAVNDIKSDIPDIEHVFMCGIAAGIPNSKTFERHIRLGDIVIAYDGVLYFGGAKKYGEDLTLRPTAFTIPGETGLKSAAKRLRAKEAGGDRPWEGFLDQAVVRNSKWARPAENTDNWCDGVLYIPLLKQWLKLRRSHPKDRRRLDRPGKPIVSHGLIGSSDWVIADHKFRNDLQKNLKIIAIEMEGAGVALGAIHGDMEFLVVRGACDYASETKNDDWQEHAAAQAAAMTLALIAELPVRKQKWKRAIADIPGNQVLQELASTGAVSGSFETSHLETGALPTADSQVFAADSQGQAEAPSTTSVVMPESSAPTNLVVDEIERELQQLDQLQDNYQLQDAFRLAEKIKGELDLYKSTIPKELRANALYKLSLIAVAEAEMAKLEGKSSTLDLREAKRLLALVQEIDHESR